MQAPPKKNPGITLIELIVVIGIFGILLSAVSWSLSGFMNANQLNIHTEQLVHQLRTAQSHARLNLKDAHWGIHLDHNDGGPHGSYTFFKGETFGADPEFDMEFPLPRSVRLTSLNIEGDSDSIVFEKNSGTTHTTGSFVVYNHNDPDTHYTISINALGRVELQK